MIEAGDTVCVGVSGGADSVCLLSVLCELSGVLGIGRGKIIAVHVNHGIRGDEALRDENYVREFCERIGVKLYVRQVDVPALAGVRRETIEETGRSERYKAFADALREAGDEYGINVAECGKIAVAHNRMDNAETILFHLIRGSGIKGACGIPPVRGNIIRPLLETGREDIEAYLRDKGIGFVVDSTNLHLDYDRNKIRHEILPVLKSINSGAEEHITDFARDMQVIEGKLARDTERNFKEAVAAYADVISLSVSRLLMMDDLMQRRVLYSTFEKISGSRKDVTSKHICGMQKLLYADSGARIDLPYGIVCRKNYDMLILEGRRLNEDTTEPIRLENGSEVRLSAGCISMQIVDINSQNIDYKKKYTKAFDCDKIVDTLCVRKPADGDYIVINSDGRRKSINKLFIDLKLDRETRKRVPVVCIGNEVLWAVGVRGTENYHITKDTKRAIVLEYTEF